MALLLKENSVCFVFIFWTEKIKIKMTYHNLIQKQIVPNVLRFIQLQL